MTLLITHLYAFIYMLSERTFIALTKISVSLRTAERRRTDDTPRFLFDGSRVPRRRYNTQLSSLSISLNARQPHRHS